MRRLSVAPSASSWWPRRPLGLDLAATAGSCEALPHLEVPMSEEFDRCRPHVTLTPEGCDFVDLAEQILMRRFELDSERAHTLLVRAAHHHRTKLYDICAKVCDAHFHPEDRGDPLIDVLPPAVVNEQLDLDAVAELRHLAELREAGFLTASQFEARGIRASRRVAAADVEAETTSRTRVTAEPGVRR